MRLCDREILQWIKEKKIIINPKPLSKNIHGITVDIHLDNKFLIFKENTIPYIDLSKKKNNKNLKKAISEEITLKFNEKFFLHPGKLVLGITIESVSLPGNMVAWLDGKSSLARLGLIIHLTANRIDPGWSGKILLELFNLGKFPLVLKKGILIGALSFELLSNFVEYPYNKRLNSKYKNQKKIIYNQIDQE